MTRRQQYDARQRKWKLKRRRLHNHNAFSRVPNASTNSHGGGKVWAYVMGDLQNPLQLVGRRSSQMLPDVTHPDVIPSVVAGGDGKPPYGVLNGLYVIRARARGVHGSLCLVGLHRRRVSKIGRKIGRMDGAARKLMGANWFCIENNFFPDWDPLDRKPQAADIDNGADYIDIDWRWGVTGF